MTRAPSRHGKPRSVAKRLLDRLVDARRKTFPILLAGLVVLGAAGFGVYQRLEEHPAKRAAEPKRPASAGRSTAPSATGSPADQPGEDGDPDAEPYAEAYLREAAPDHLESVRWSGDFLRVYTDLDEGDTTNSDARKLCELAVQYLKDTYRDLYKDDGPVVFVHARRSGNGNVVLVNNVSGRCRPVETR